MGMTQLQNSNGHATAPARKVAEDDATDRAPDPKRHFQSPEMLLADESLTDAEKHALLSEWDLELDNRLRAEEEGMSASDPMRGRQEAKLADEAGRVKSCLTDLAGRLGNP
jgi:hypothetical protein